MVANRFKGDRHLDGPATIEPPRLHDPHRIPIGVGISLVGNDLVGTRAKRIRVELEAVAPVVKRVEDDAEIVVLAEL